MADLFDIVVARKLSDGGGGGGGGGSWQTVFEGSVTTTAGEEGATIPNLSLFTADIIKVTFDGTEYTCEQLNDGSYGALYSHGSYDWSEYPFSLYEDGGMKIATESAGTYTLKIEEQQSGGSSDFSTATMTVINTKSDSESGGIQCNSCPVAWPDDGELSGGFYVEANSQYAYDVILYKGQTVISSIVTGSSLNEDIDLETDVALSGDATLKMGICITGDCTITIS